MKILSVTNCPLNPTLGSGKTVLRYTAGLRKLGHTVDILDPESYNSWPPARRGQRFLQTVCSWTAIRNRLREKKYDLIEFYGGEFWLSVKKLSELADHPLLVAHTNGLELLFEELSEKYCKQDTASPGKMLKRWLSDSLQNSMMKYAFSASDCFVSLCAVDRQYVLENSLYAPEQTAIVPPGLDEEFVSIEDPFTRPREERIAYAGSWTERKGIHTIAKVISTVLERRPAVHFDMYGSKGDPLSILSEFPATVRERIMIHPNVSNRELVNGLQQAKVFFFPSIYEGYGMALAEALACGLAAVCTPTGFGADLKHKEEAIICPFQDHEQMIKAIENILDDDELRMKLGRKGWEKTRNQTWQNNVAKLETVYRKWLDEQQASK